ncbi:glycosyltransferase family 4 protein [Desulfovibrio sp. OttesenSCG-928-C06]|nr:glycosyltransferase family 4 protein [Desulfovibrio sp. OttesenSCG-928-C06]
MPTTEITWLTQGGATLPSVRFRVEALRHVAAEYFSGVRVTRLPKSLFQRVAFYASLSSMDICVIQKRLLSGMELSILRKKSKLLVYDFDDAVWTEQEAPMPPESGQHRKEFCRACKSVDLVVAGNAYLAAAVPDGVPRVIMPSPIDTGIYCPAGNEATSTVPVIGWMGTGSYLPQAMQVFGEIAALGCPMHVVSNREPEPGTATPVTFTRWSPDNELALLQGFDVGLMPLEDTIYTRGKGGFKLLQYMACGVVPVASAVGMNREIITDGVDGFLVEPGKPWLPVVERLKDPALRARMGLAARQTAVERFDLRKVASGLFTQILEHYRSKL